MANPQQPQEPIKQPEKQPNEMPDKQADPSKKIGEERNPQINPGGGGNVGGGGQPRKDRRDEGQDIEREVGDQP
jgi:hypothetical protein